MSVRDDDERIRKALDDLNQLIIARVERERRRDQLTGLPNGLALEESLDRHIQAGRDLWAAFVEIDKFKSVNDRFGYESADELLKAVAAMLAQVSASFPGSAEVFRQHGDEFFILGAHDSRDDHRRSRVFARHDPREGGEHRGSGAAGDVDELRSDVLYGQHRLVGRG